MAEESTTDNQELGVHCYDAVTATFTLVGVKAGETATIGLFETSLFTDKALCLHRVSALSLV